MINIDEIRLYLVEHDIKSGRPLTAKKHKHIRDALISETRFLDEYYGGVAMTVRFEYVLGGMSDIPKCKYINCKKYTSADKSGFGVFCSYKCNADHRSIKLSARSMESDPDYFVRRNEKSKKKFQQRAKDAGYVNWEEYTHSSMFPDIVDKRRQTHLKNSGHTNNMKSPDGIQKWKDVFEEKYGVSNPMHVEEFNKKSNWCYMNDCWKVQTDEFLERSRESTLERYGVTNPMHSPHIVEKVRKSNMSRYDRISPNQQRITSESLDILGDKEKLNKLMEDNFMEEVATQLGVHRSSIQRACAIFEIPVKKSQSMQENSVADYVESLGFTVDRGVYFKSIKREADILIEDKKLIIEYNGVYWHCEDFKNPSYHQQKTKNLHDLGYSVINIWEDDWVDPQKNIILKNKIKAKLGVPDARIFARKCEVSFIGRNDVVDFFNNNHIQGHVDGSYYIGLLFNDHLVACMTMKRSKDNVYDLSRFATSQSVIGGASRCLAYFKRNVEWSEIFTFASLDYSSGDVYERVGFTKQHTTDPNMWYMKRGEWVRLGRRRFTKSKLPNILEVYDPNISETDNMRNNGYVRIFDCGSIKYSMINE